MKPPVRLRQSVGIADASPESAHLNAYLEYAVGDFDTAGQILDGLIRASPNEAAFHFDRGLTLWHARERAAAAEAFERAEALDPAFADAIYNAAIARNALGEDGRAAANFRKALRSDPTLVFKWLKTKLRRANPEILERYGWRIATKEFPAVRDAISYGMMRTGNLNGAAEQLRIALELETTANRLCALGVVLGEMGDQAGAIRQFEAALKLDQSAVSSAEQLGILLDQAQRHDEARSYYERAVALEPSSILAQSQLLALDVIDGRLDRVAGDHARLITALERSDLRQTKWELLAAIAHQCIGWPIPSQLHRMITRTIDEQVKSIASKHRQLITPHQHGVLPPSPRMRIGYLSARLAEHSMAESIKTLFGVHDRSRFEVHVFHMSRKTSPAVDLIAKGVEFFHRVTGSVVQVAEFIQTRNLDLLIYLDGYAVPGLLQVMALQPAPARAFWLGHPDGCEVSSVEYLIADAVVIPPGEETKYRAEVIRLPQTYQCAATEEVPTPPPRSEAGLPTTGFVFCALSPLEMIDPQSFEAWLRIVRQCDGSVLWLRAGRGPGRADALRKLAAEKDVAPERLIFAEPAASRAEELARYGTADLFLDCLGQNAAATTLDALAAGLPVLTVRGDRFATRQTASQLHAIGLDEMACPTATHYEARAVALAKDPIALARVRTRLAANLRSHPLFETTTFCRALEDAAISMIEKQRVKSRQRR